MEHQKNTFRSVLYNPFSLTVFIRKSHSKIHSKKGHRSSVKNKLQLTSMSTVSDFKGRLREQKQKGQQEPEGISEERFI